MSRFWWMRHAEAAPGAVDAQRALTPYGQQQAQQVGQWLQQQSVQPEAIYSSHYLRARQTAEALGRALQLVPEVLSDVTPEHSVDQALAQLWPLSGRAVLVVTHQPLWGAMMARLYSEPNQPWAIPPAGLAWMDGEVIAPDCLHLKQVLAEVPCELDTSTGHGAP